MTTRADRVPYYGDDFAHYEGAQPTAALGGDISKDIPWANSYALYNENAFDLTLDWIFSTDIDRRWVSHYGRR